MMAETDTRGPADRSDTRHVVRHATLAVVLCAAALFGSSAAAFASNGAALTIANQTMEGTLAIPVGAWIAAGYQFQTPSRSAVTFNNAQVALPVACSRGASTVGTIVVQLATGPYTSRNNAMTPWKSPDSKHPLAYQGAVQAPDLCAGATMYNSTGATFSASVASAASTQVSVAFHYAVPQALGQSNTDCYDASSPGATDSGICGTNLSEVASVDPTPGSTPDVVPALTCVAPGLHGDFTAYFGYGNSGDSVSYPKGRENFVTPSELDGGEPTQFISGTVSNAFSVVVPSGEHASWTVAGKTAQAQSTDTVCTGSTLSQDRFGISLILAVGGGALIGALVVRRASRGRANA